ncbi:MAG TPA: hypothetical protein VLE02_01035 [Nitrosarchaeum sp.]|nr:hypothetical protein [Nitrosarchaeum sp.]
MNRIYLIGGILILLVLAGVVYYTFFRKSNDNGGNGGDPHPAPPIPPAKSEVFAIATWDSNINNYSRTWAPDYNMARQRAISTVNLPVASYDQITAAWQDGFCVCNWGWIQPNPNFDIILPSQGTGDIDTCGSKQLYTQKGPSANVSCIFVYGPKPKFDSDANDPRSPLYRGYVILAFEFGKPRNRWSQYD